MEIPPLILDNLTMQIGNLPDKTNEVIANWCYSQHFAFEYVGIQLIIVAAVCLIIKGIIIDYKIKIPEKKFWIFTISREKILSDLDFLITYAVYIFLLFFLYKANDWHFADAVLRFIGFTV